MLGRGIQGAVAIGLLVALPAAMPARAEVHQFRTVAVTGDPAPGFPPGSFFVNGSTTLGFSRPTINGSGQVAFWSAVDAGVTLAKYGIWTETPSGLAAVAVTDMIAPGVTGAPFATFVAELPISDSGQIAFSAVLGQPAPITVRDGFWRGGAGTLGEVARETLPAPGVAPGILFQGPIGGPRISDSGYSAFAAFLQGPGVSGANNHGFWAESPSGLRLVMREGSAAPGLPVGSNLGSTNVYYLNSAGQLAFPSRLTGSAVNATNDSAFWSESAGTLSLVAREGMPAPGTPAGVVFGEISTAGRYGFNDLGQVALSLGLTGPGVDSSNSTGLWTSRSGPLSLEYRTGDPAPYFQHPNVRWAGFTRTLLNNAGDLFFISGITGPGISNDNDLFMWLDDGDDLTPLAREGTQPPGTEPGVYFVDFLFQTQSLNAVGQVVFGATINGPGVSDANEYGLWSADRHGNTALVVRTGDQIEIAPGDIRTIQTIEQDVVTGGDDGLRRALSDTGDYAFRAHFTDGSEGIFVAHIPEPATAVMLVIGGAVALARRGKHRAW